ncbi:MAG: ECF transporter S component, partial [Lachnospiraceae bacterium]|nr:ECF transporter S component [Lachnospiraceae bacterium]
MNNLINTARENLPTVAGFVLTIISLFVIAYVAQKIQKKREGTKERILNTRALVIIGMFSAVAAVLMLFEVPLPFAPSFYKFDFSEIPVMICACAYGPVAGVMTEFLKIILKLIFKGTSTAFVGDLANFAVGCSY